MLFLNAGHLKHSHVSQFSETTKKIQLFSLSQIRCHSPVSYFIIDCFHLARTHTGFQTDLIQRLEDLGPEGDCRTQQSQKPEDQHDSR